MNKKLLVTLFGQVSRAFALTCAHVRRDQIYTSFSSFGHPVQINASCARSISCYSNLLAKEMQDMFE